MGYYQHGVGLYHVYIEIYHAHIRFHQFFIHLKHGPQVDDVTNELRNLEAIVFTPLLDPNWILLDYLLSHSIFPTLHCILACLHLFY
jgi:hypothetical protein